MSTDLDKSVDQALKDLQGAYAKQRAGEQALAGTEKARSDEISKLIDSMPTKADLQAPGAPKLPARPEVPQPDPIKSFGSFASVLGIIGSALLKQPLSTSLNAGAAAMRAANQADWAQYEEHLKAWKDATDQAYKQADWEHKQYSEALDLMKTNAALGSARISMLNTLTQYDAMRVAHESGLGETVQMVNALGKLKEGLAASALKAETFAANQAYRAQTLQLMQARNMTMMPGLGLDPTSGKQVMGAYILDKNAKTPDAMLHFVPTGGAIGAQAVSAQVKADIEKGQMPDDQTIEGMVAQRVSGEPINEIVPGWSGQGVAGQLKLRVNAGAIQKIMADHPGWNPAQAGEYLANQQSAYLGSRNSTKQLMTFRGATIAAVKQLDYNLDQASQILTQLGGNATPVLNAIARGEEKWTGDPKYSQLFVAMSAATQEAARIMSGGQASISQLHEGARDEAKQWMNINWTTPQQFEAIKQFLKGEAQNRIGNWDSAMQFQKMTDLGVSGAPDTAGSGGGAQVGSSKDAPLDVSSEADAEKQPKGTWVRLNGRIGQVQ